MDLVVRNAQLARYPEGQLMDIGVSSGTIAAIEPSLTVDAEIFDAGGRLTCGGLIETHIHLDKSRLLGRCPTPCSPTAAGVSDPRTSTPS